MRTGEALQFTGSFLTAAGMSKERLQPPVSEELCYVHLEKVAASATFARAEQLRRLIEWLGRRSLTPGTPAPAEKEIGEIVLNRKDFDPQTDSLVRKEMSRLREKLAQYYDKEGARDRVRIRNAGGYLFRFAWAELSTREPVDERDLPCVLVLPLRSPADLSEQREQLLEELLVRLGEQGGVKLVSPTTALSYLGRTGDVREFAAECGADFVVEGSLDLSGEQLRATLWFVDGRSGRTERPGRFAGISLGELVQPAAAWLMSHIVLHS